MKNKNEIKSKKRISKRFQIINGIFILIIIIVVSGCGKVIQPISEELIQSAEVEQVQPAEEIKEIITEEKYFINFDINLKNRNIEISGETDIQDNSILDISINRFVEYNEMEGKRVVSLDDGEAKVMSGKFAYSVYLTDKDWYEKDLQENKNFGFSFKKIYEDCYVLITSENVQVKKEFTLPFEKTVVEKEYLLFCSPQLEINERCKLSKEIPLMPELEPKDPLVALEKIQSIPSGNIIRVINIVEKDTTPWYYVNVEGIGNGWINSIALY